MQTVQNFLSFLQKSPSAYHAVEALAARLTAEGYACLSEAEPWTLAAGGKYFTVRGGTSLVAFRVPAGAPTSFVMAAAHSDSPTFKIKENPELVSGPYVRLNTEKYGGMIMSTWMDRPLSVAGRLVVRTENGLAQRLCNVDRDLLVIPSLAIHMNRNVNDGTKLAANVDTLPLFGDGDARDAFLPTVAAAAGVDAADIVAKDLYLYCRDRGGVIGAAGEYIAAPQLDDLECAWALTEGFLAASETAAIPVLAVFDNEEVGSETRQGAASAMLGDLLRRITLALGIGEEGLQCLLAKSFLVSADNAHALHPNHPEYADGANCPVMNGGIVVKYNANRRYATDAVSDALFKQVCAEAGVSVQAYANRSDLAGGSTLGSIASARVPVHTVDIGLAQLAMHSAYETAGTRDLADLVRAMTVLFSADAHTL